MADENRIEPNSPPAPVPAAPLRRRVRLRRRSWLVLVLLAPLLLRVVRSAGAAAWEFILRLLRVSDREHFWGLFILAACVCAGLACIKAITNRR